MQSTIGRSPYLLPTSVWALLLFAQTAPAQPDASEKTPLALEEVIVTAERRVATLQETPISISAFDSERLEIEGIGNLEDIGTKVPSVAISNFPTNDSTLRIFIRGIGLNDSQITQDSPVAVYIDGIYVARNVGTAMEVAELQRIEVLRGPQGTLYGRNSTGGAVNMITRRPNTDTFEFDQTVTGGNRDLFSSRTAANIPLSDALAVRLAYLHRQRDGFVKNGGPGDGWGDREVDGYRLDLRWSAGERYTLDYSYDRTESEFANYTYQAILPRTPSGLDSDLVLENANQKVRDGPGYTDRRLERLDSEAPLETSTNDIEGHSLTLAADYGIFELRYLFGYRELDNASYSDLGSGAADEEYRLDSNTWTAPDGRRFPLVFTEIFQEQASHELQLSGDLPERAVSYILGAYYFEEKADYLETPQFHQFHGQLDATTLPGLGANTTIAALRERIQHIENTAWAVFGQSTWTPSWAGNRLHLTAGARYSEDDREAFAFHHSESLAFDNTTGAGTTLSESGYAADVERDFDDFSFSLVIEYDLTPDINLYAKRAEAYKSGGFNVRDPDRDGSDNEFGIGFVDGFEEEKVVSYEVGMKSELFDRRLRLNASVFTQEIEDMQINFLVPGTLGDTKATNAGEGEIEGSELDITWLAARGLVLMLSYAYLDASMTEIINPATGEDVSEEFLFPRAPRHSGTSAFDWTLWEGGWGKLSLHGSFNYMEDHFADTLVQHKLGSHMETRRLWNARLRLSEIPTGGYGTFNIGLWGKNLGDQEYAQDAIAVLPHADRSVVWGEPRTYGVDVIYRY